MVFGFVNLDFRNPDSFKRMIYVFKTSNFVKIGFSNDIPRRLKELQAANPELITLVGAVPGTMALEHAIHRKLRAHRCEGGSEWYRMSTFVMDFVKDLHGNGLLRLLES